MPGLKELRRWVIGGIGICVSMLIGSLVLLAINNNRQQDFMYQMLLQKAQESDVVKRQTP
jgi:uncharacterized membrane-anchored protein YhcB (DUF1043 family)